MNFRLRYTEWPLTQKWSTTIPFAFLVLLVWMKITLEADQIAKFGVFTWSPKHPTFKRVGIFGLDFLTAFSFYCE